MKTTGYYILQDAEVKPASMLEWQRFMESPDREIALTQIDEVKVLTVFLGIDRLSPAGTVMLFQTLIFGGEHDRDTLHYATLEESMLGHEYMVALASGEVGE